MKLIVAGSTGLVGTEIIRQSLEISEITSVIALARKPIQIKESAHSSNLKSVVISDYGDYPDHVKAEFAGADACIWTVAVTPFKASSLDFAEVKRVCQDCTTAGFKAMYGAGPARPFRFIYFSAEGTPRDLTKKPYFMGEYRIMRGETEHKVLAFPTEHEGVEVCIAHPGAVTNSSTWLRAALASLFYVTNTFTRVVPNVSQEQLAAAVLDQAMRGWEMNTLSNADLVRLGTAALESE